MKAFIVVVAFSFLFLLTFEFWLQSTDLCKTARAAIVAEQRIQDKVGPLKGYGWLVTVGQKDGKTRLTNKVHGEKGDISVDVWVVQYGDKWIVDTLSYPE
jgi:hypothetical protein